MSYGEAERCGQGMLFSGGFRSAQSDDAGLSPCQPDADQHGPGSTGGRYELLQGTEHQGEQTVTNMVVDLLRINS